MFDSVNSDFKDYELCFLYQLTSYRSNIVNDASTFAICTAQNDSIAIYLENVW